MKNILKVAGVITFLVLAILTCSWTIKENERARDEFVATVNYLQPQEISYHFGGSRKTQDYRPPSDDRAGQSEEWEYWSYDLLLKPVSKENAIVGYCTPNEGRPGCIWEYFVITTYLEKDNVKYVFAYTWQSGTNFDPEAWLNSLGYTVTQSQYFIATQTNQSNNPVMNPIIIDVDTLMSYWTSAVNEREGRIPLNIKY